MEINFAVSICLTFLFLASEFSQGQSIICVDISGKIQNVSVQGKTQDSEWHKKLVDPDEIIGQIFYYETDLDEFITDKLIMIPEWVTKTRELESTDESNPPHFIFSLRYKTTVLLNPTSNKTKSLIIPKHLPQVTKYLETSTAKLKLAFEYTGSDNSCPVGKRFKNPPTGVSAITSIKSFLQTTLIQVGFTIDYNLLKCHVFYKDMIEADFIIVKLNYNQYKEFIESYGAFHRDLNSAIKATNNYLSEIRNDESKIFYRVEYTHDMNEVGGTKIQKAGERNDENYRSSTRRNYMPWGHSSAIKIRDTSQVEKVNNDDYAGGSVNELKINQIYRCLFEAYVQEYAIKEQENIVLDVHQNCGIILEEMSSDSESLFVPDITDFLYKYPYSHGLMRSTHDLIGNQYDTVRLYFPPEKNFHQYNNLFARDYKIFLVENNTRNHISVIKPLDANTYYLTTNMAFHRIIKLLYKDISNTTENITHVDTNNLIQVSGHKLSADINDFVYGSSQKPDSLLNTDDKNECSCKLTIANVGRSLYLDTIHELELDYAYALSFMNTSFWRVRGNLEFCNELVLDVQIRIDLDELEEYQDISRRENIIIGLRKRLIISKNLLQRRWPMINLIWRLNIQPFKLLGYFSEREESLYCNPNKNAVSELLDGILTLANIHRFQMILGVLPMPELAGPLSWKKLEIERSVERRYQDSNYNVLYKYPLFVKRRYNSSKVFGKWANDMFQCLDWSYEVPTTDIFKNSDKIGTYLDPGFEREGTQNLTDDEILNLITFAAASFKLTEVKVATHTEIWALIKALKHPNFIHNMLDRPLNKSEILLNIPLEAESSIPPNFKNIFTNVSSEVEVSLKVHFSPKSNVDQNFMHKFAENILEEIQANILVDIGLTMGYCNDVVREAMKFQEKEPINGTREHTQSLLLTKASYLVCKVPARNYVGNYRMVMQRFLETHLYIKRLLQIFYPNLKEVYFKMLPAERLSTQEYSKELLLLLTHMTNFARIYNLSYLLLPGFSAQGSNISSWWEISNYTDLSDVDYLRDIWSSHLGKEPWRPTTEKEKSSTFEGPVQNETNRFTFWILLGLVGTIILLAILFITVVIRFKRKVELLSDEEIQEFIKGRQADVAFAKEAGLSLNGSILNSGYNKSLEICKDKICLDLANVLGSGNFGIVCKASLTCLQGQRRDVAVKMPKIGCDKETFIGMLREVKLLGYLGSHQNVVEFIGCYTKEIRAGVLYIVMEQCTHGPLDSHLRLLNGSKSCIGKDLMFPDLVRFCHEISSGMEFISSQKVIHGDLSAKNILLNELHVCKIADFGLSRKLYDDGIYKKKTSDPLPWRWMAYETLSTGEVSTMSDIWSFGVVTWEIFTLGNLPYNDANWTDDFCKELEQGMRLPKPDLATEQINEWMTKCWNIKPEQRPTFTAITSLFASVLPYAKIM